MLLVMTYPLCRPQKSLEMFVLHPFDRRSVSLISWVQRNTHSKRGLDANWINVCKTSPKAFPPVMLFADALNEMSQRERVSLYAERAQTGKARTSLHCDPPDAGAYFLPPVSTVAYRERDNMENVITQLPNVRESHLFCRPFDCYFLRWQMWLGASSNCYHPIWESVFWLWKPQANVWVKKDATTQRQSRLKIKTGLRASSLWSQCRIMM